MYARIDTGNLFFSMPILSSTIYYNSINSHTTIISNDLSWQIVYQISKSHKLYNKFCKVAIKDKEMFYYKWRCLHWQKSIS